MFSMETQIVGCCSNGNGRSLSDVRAASLTVCLYLPEGMWFCVVFTLWCVCVCVCVCVSSRRLGVCWSEARLGVTIVCAPECDLT